MRKSRFTESQIVGILTQGTVEFYEGKAVDLLGN